MHLSPSRKASIPVAIAVIALLASLAAAEPSGEQDLKARANDHVNSALAAEADGRYDDAISDFKAAYELVPHPELLFDLGLAFRRSGGQREAVRYFRQYLAVDEHGYMADEARRLIGVLERELGTIDDDASLAAPLTLGAPAPTPPGLVPASSELDRAPSAIDDDDDDPLITRRRLAFAIGGAGVAIAGVGAVFAVRAHGKWTEAAALCGDDLTCNTPAEQQVNRGLQDDAHTATVTAAVLFATGAAAIAGGVVLYLTDHPRDRAASLRIAPRLSADTAALSLAGTF